MDILKKTALCLSFALVGCNENRDNGLQQQSINTKPPTSSPTPIVSSKTITATLSAISPSISLENFAKLTLSEPDAANRPNITISETKTPAIESVMAVEANMYEIEKTADSEITIKTTKPLSGDVDIVINVPTKLVSSLKETEGVLPYFFESSTDDEGITPLSAKYIVPNRTVSAKIPAKAFMQQDDGTWKAIIKLAVVNTYPSQEIESVVASQFKSVKSLPAIGGRKPVVKCPLPKECIETSGFHMRGGGTHDGIDLKAEMNTNVVVPIEGSFSVINALRYDRSRNSAGTHVSLEQKFFWLPIKLKFFHLNSMLVQINDIVSYGELIGKSGQSGFGRVDFHNPHLHMELLKPSMKFESCGENLESSECKISFAVGLVDPFPHMLQRVEIEKTDSNGNVENSDIELNKPFILQLEGYDDEEKGGDAKKIGSAIARNLDEIRNGNRARHVKWEIFDENGSLVAFYPNDSSEDSEFIKIENVSEAPKDFDKKKLTVLQGGKYKAKAYWDGTELKAEYDFDVSACAANKSPPVIKSINYVCDGAGYGFKLAFEDKSGIIYGDGWGGFDPENYNHHKTRLWNATETSGEYTIINNGHEVELVEGDIYKGVIRIHMVNNNYNNYYLGDGLWRCYRGFTGAFFKIGLLNTCHVQTISTPVTLTP